jgi:hypothetical protein
MKYQQPRGLRYNKGFAGVDIEGYWYNMDTLQWEADPLWGKFTYTNIGPCRTFKAFRRLLRKHPEFKGNARLIHRLVDCDILG